MRLLLREVGYVSNYLIVFTSGMYFAFSTEIKFRQCAGGIHLPIYKKIQSIRRTDLQKNHSTYEETRLPNRILKARLSFCRTKIDTI